MSGFLGFVGNLFSGNRNVIAETAEVFRPNAENQAQREAEYNRAALGQYSAEFHDRQNRNLIDSLADALNRLIRPVLTIGIVFPIPMTIYDPAAMAEVWQTLAEIPQEYWYLFGIVVGFYFGGRMQIKGQNFRQAVASSVAAVVAPQTSQPVEPTGRNYAALADEVD